MTRYVMGRLVLLLPTVIGISLIIFAVMRIMPGDPVTAMMVTEGSGAASVTEEGKVRIREKLGLNKPLYLQYADWVWDLARLDLGTSLWTGSPLTSDFKVMLPVTVELVIIAMVIQVVLTGVVGVLSALRQDTWVDYALRGFTIGGLAMPSFWVGILILLGLTKYFHWIPPLGYQSIFADPWVNLQMFFFPAVVLAWRGAAVSGRMLRSSMLEVLRQDYVRTARAKGLGERAVILRHAVKNSALPVVTILGMQTAFMFGGVVVIESVFSLPGIGRGLVNSVMHRDYLAVQHLLVFFALVVVLSNLAVDLIYGWLDPRIRYT